LSFNLLSDVNKYVKSYKAKARHSKAFGGKALDGRLKAPRASIRERPLEVYL